MKKNIITILLFSTLSINSSDYIIKLDSKNLNQYIEIVVTYDDEGWSDSGVN